MSKPDLSSLVSELRWRGMIHDMTPGTEAQLAQEVTAGYIGFDPTAKSLHIGNLATIMLLVHLQRAGHVPVALVGGATGMIGDPSGKSAERQLLDEATLRDNQAGIRQQLEKFLDFDAPDNPARLVNNYDWFGQMGFLHFLREAGKHLTVNYMMAKDSVKSRLETGLSFTEFSYQLLQGYDFYHLYEHHNVKLQMGGFRPVGQHHHRHRIHPPQGEWRCLRPHHPAGDQSRRHQIWEVGGGQRVVRPRTHFALSVLPVLAQRSRRRLRSTHSGVHPEEPGRD